VTEVREELTDRYGPPPAPVENLLAVASFRVRVRAAGLAEVQQLGKQIRLSPVELPESRVLRLQRLYKGSIVKPAAQVALVPAPVPPLRDEALLAWATELIDQIFEPAPVPA
jgi:transcription-repair coupling factor (superfamily II helicase)